MKFHRLLITLVLSLGASARIETFPLGVLRARQIQSLGAPSEDLGWQA